MGRGELRRLSGCGVVDAAKVRESATPAAGGGGCGVRHAGYRVSVAAIDGLRSRARDCPARGRPAGWLLVVRAPLRASGPAARTLAAIRGRSGFSALWGDAGGS